MIEREYKIIKFQDGIERLTATFNLKNQEVLSTFLHTDVSQFADWIKEAFDNVISGESEYEEISGNICCAEISPTTTKIYNEMIEDEEEYYSTCCEVDTQELREIIAEWCEKSQELN